MISIFSFLAMETTTANFDNLPYELVVLICSQLFVEDLLSFSRCSKSSNRICTSDDVWRYFKKKQFTDKWKFTAKVDSMSIPIIEKIKTKILLQNNWKNSDLIPNVFSLPQFDGELLHASTMGTRLLLLIQRENHDRAELFVYDLETLKLVNTIEYLDEFKYTEVFLWDGGDRLVIGRKCGVDGEAGVGSYMHYCWDLILNTIWLIDSCVTSGTRHTSIHGNYFFYLQLDGGFYVLDLSTRQYVIKQIFVGCVAAYMHIESRGAIIFQQNRDKANDKLIFVQFSEDWHILFEKEIDIKVKYMNDFKVTKNYIVVAFANEKNTVMVFDRTTFNTIVTKDYCVSFEVLADDIINTIQSYRSGGFENRVYNLKNNTTVDVHNTDLFHIQSDLFLSDYESYGIGPITQVYSVMSLPDKKKVQVLTTLNGNTLHERYTNLFKQFEWYSEHYQLQQVLVNQSQIVVIYQKDKDVLKTAVFILDFCDAVFQY